MKLAMWYCDNKVQFARQDSIHIRLWRLASTTFFKTPLLNRFAKTLDYPRRLRSIEAAPRFLNTLNKEGDFGSFVNSLKNDHGIKLVYCWHALTGELPYAVFRALLGSVAQSPRCDCHH
jgi:hypothetical protein